LVAIKKKEVIFVMSKRRPLSSPRLQVVGDLTSSTFMGGGGNNSKTNIGLREMSEYASIFLTKSPEK
jgi:hypothetical protein